MWTVSGLWMDGGGGTVGGGLQTLPRAKVIVGSSGKQPLESSAEQPSIVIIIDTPLYIIIKLPAINWMPHPLHNHRLSTITPQYFLTPTSYHGQRPSSRDGRFVLGRCSPCPETTFSKVHRRRSRRRHSWTETSLPPWKTLGAVLHCSRYSASPRLCQG